MLNFEAAPYLRLAAADRLALSDYIAKTTAFKNFPDLLGAKGGYRPSLDVSDPNNELLADVYDLTMESLRDDRRAFRYGTEKAKADRKAAWDGIDPETKMLFLERVADAKKTMIAEAKAHNPEAGYVAAETCAHVLCVDKERQERVADPDFIGRVTKKEIIRSIAHFEEIPVEEVLTTEWKHDYIVEGEVNCATSLKQYLTRYDSDSDWDWDGWIDAREWWSVDITPEDLKRGN